MSIFQPKVLPKVTVEFAPLHRDDDKPYLATVEIDGSRHHGKANNPSEALLLVAAHWHSRGGK